VFKKQHWPSNLFKIEGWVVDDVPDPFVGAVHLPAVCRLTVIVSFSDVFGLLQTILANDNLAK